MQTAFSIRDKVLRATFRSVDCQNPIPYTTDSELDDTIYEILREAASTADSRNCFIEAEVIAMDDSDRYW